MKLKLSKPGSDRERPEVFARSLLITPQLQGTKLSLPFKKNNVVDSHPLTLILLISRSKMQVKSGIGLQLVA